MTETVPGRARLDVRAVLFDLDGTLADTAPDLADAANRVRADRGLPALPLEALRGYASHGARGLLKAALDVDRDDEDYEALRESFLRYYANGLCGSSRLFDGAAQLLDELDARGLRWGIVTNKAQRYTLPLAAFLALTPRAGALVCGDTTPHAKPAGVARRDPGRQAPALALSQRGSVPGLEPDYAQVSASRPPRSTRARAASRVAPQGCRSRRRQASARAPRPARNTRSAPPASSCRQRFRR